MGNAEALRRVEVAKEADTLVRLMLGGAAGKGINGEHNLFALVGQTLILERKQGG